MKLPKLNNRKGVAGLELFLSLIAMLFVIGIIVMVFVLSGSKMKDAITDTDAQNVINVTYHSLEDTTDWFSTFIVLGAMVVLVLLVVVVIQAIRGSGLTGSA